ncbi:hypothetical protein TorRG33x02_081680 [Trema orientale]|uniref:Uncharacterized protein n=2 Tax=Cannabaceae TaxID=3481 RepID=A0A2P5AZR2_PARAD|nr:hypothetical protein PanWU01x14_285370 [Parasponia andersonii]PON95920.1 hypothetical protein TorRG33x02_081680 [Trema orientale]
MVLNPIGTCEPEALILYGGSSHLVFVMFLQSKQHIQPGPVPVGHCLPFGIVHFPEQKFDISFMSIHRPSTGTSSWKRRISSTHQETVFGLRKSGKLTAPGQT